MSGYILYHISKPHVQARPQPLDSCDRAGMLVANEFALFRTIDANAAYIVAHAIMLPPKCCTIH